MALPASGQISLSDVNVELSKSVSAQIALNDADVRDLAGIASGQISMSDLWGKTADRTWDISYATYTPPLTGVFSVGAQTFACFDMFFKPDGTKMYVVDAVPDRILEYNLGTAWNVSTASFVQAFSVNAQESNPSGLFFKPDGTKMYVVGYTSDRVHEYNLSTAWDVSTASFVQNFLVSAQENTPTGLSFKPDGTKMYVIGNNSDRVHEYNLGTAWDVATASFVQNFLVSAQDSQPEGMFFRSDGLKMYVVGTVNDRVYEYNLGTAWNVSTASFVQSFSFATQDGGPSGVSFKSDGTKMYIIGNDNKAVYEYNLSTAWNVATAQFSGSPVNAFSVLDQEGVPQDVFFRPDGTKMYVVGVTSDRVHEYNLGTAWDVSTASFVQNFLVSAQDSDPTGLFFKPDGTKMYMIGNNSDRVHEYNLGTAWDVSTASFVQNFSVSARDSLPTGLFFKPDGTKMYVVGRSIDAVWSYDLSTAWNVATAQFNGSPVNSFSVVAQETASTGLFFKPDGLKMYVIGRNNDRVHEYNLGTAWDVSTASFVQNFSVSAQDTNPQDVFFKPDGTKMYVLGDSGNDVNEYNLGTAWNISTASFVQNFSVSAQEDIPSGMFFKPDGTKMYVTGRRNDRVEEYNLSTAWNISTASFVQNFSVRAQDGQPDGVFFKPDGTKMYIAGAAGENVNEYNLGTAWDVSTASFVQNFSVSAQGFDPSDVFFKSDGTKMYVLSLESNEIFQYNLSTAWNISTAVYEYPTSDYFSVAAQDTIPEDVFFKPDGTKMYVLGDAGNDVNEYNLGTAWDVATASFVQNFSVSAQETAPSGLFFKPDGTKMYMVGLIGDRVYQYVISEGSQTIPVKLDAGDSGSYPGSGTVWFDLSGNDNNATLVNGVGYSSANGGVLVFDGSNDYVTPTGLTDAFWQGNWTASFWVNFDVLNTNNTAANDRILLQHGTISTRKGLHLDNRNSRFHFGLWGDDVTGTTVLTTGTWYNAVFTLNNTTRLRQIYVNGVLDANNIAGGPYTGTGSNTIIGWRALDFGLYFDGLLSSCTFYNRVLSAAEIAQTFNATRDRYGV